MYAIILNVDLESFNSKQAQDAFNNDPDWQQAWTTDEAILVDPGAWYDTPVINHADAKLVVPVLAICQNLTSGINDLARWNIVLPLVLVTVDDIVNFGITGAYEKRQQGEKEKNPDTYGEF